MLVTVPNSDNMTSSEVVRNYVDDYLNNEGFCSQDGRFCSSPADWFVIGGRWSGELAEALLLPKGESFYAKVKERFLGDEGITAVGMTNTFIENNRDEIEKLWQELGGQGNSPFSRDSYGHYGAEDDAMRLTEELYTKLLEEYEGKHKEKIGKKYITRENGEWGEHYTDKWHLAWIDTDERPLGKDLIGNSWIVVVDYHN